MTITPGFLSASNSGCVCFYLLIIPWAKETATADCIKLSWLIKVNVAWISWCSEGPEGISNGHLPSVCIINLDRLCPSSILQSLDFLLHLSILNQACPWQGTFLCYTFCSLPVYISYPYCPNRRWLQNRNYQVWRNILVYRLIFSCQLSARNCIVISNSLFINCYITIIWSQNSSRTSVSLTCNIQETGKVREATLSPSLSIFFQNLQIRMRQKMFP